MSDKLILIVDDKFSVTRMVSEYLTSKGYRTITAMDGVQGLTEARINQPDLILLDIMMPHMNGYEFIKTFRQESSAPIILLTAKIEETNKVEGLGLGADDYVTKPFSLAELAARIEAILRRVDQTFSNTTEMQYGNLRINLEKYEVFRDEHLINLTPTQFQILALLAQNPGRVYNREQILRNIQGNNCEALEKTINVHIRNLRVKIEEDPSHPKIIETVFGVGYRFNDEAAK